MKKTYSKPQTEVFTVSVMPLLSCSPGSGVYTDDPQNPGNALSRRMDYSWDEDEEE